MVDLLTIKRFLRETIYDPFFKELFSPPIEEAVKNKGTKKP